MNLNKLKDRAYQIACEHGWHEQELSDEHCLMLVITELSEAVNADRKGKHADISKFKEWQGNSLPLSEETRARRFKEDFEQYIKDSVEDELSDVIIRCLDFAGMRGWDLQEISDKVFDVSETERLIGDLTFAEIAYGICGCIFDRRIYRRSIYAVQKKREFRQTAGNKRKRLVPGFGIEGGIHKHRHPSGEIRTGKETQ